MVIATHPKEPKRALYLAEIEGIGEVYADKLGMVGVKTTDDLLAYGATRSGREKLAAATGLTPQRILEWVDRADLYRISGVGSEYSDLLETAGVDTVLELAQRNAAHLVTAFGKTVAEHPNIVRRIPTEEEVIDWIEQAKGLARAVEY